MTSKVFFFIQEFKLKDGAAPNQKVSQDEFDFESMASSYGNGVKYVSHEINYGVDGKWRLIVTYKRT